MLPGNGSVVAGVSGTGVHDRIMYCGHGGGGGFVSAFCAATSFAMVGIRIGFADAAAAKASEQIATADARASGRRCFVKLPSLGMDVVGARPLYAGQRAQSARTCTGEP